MIYYGLRVVYYIAVPQLWPHIQRLGGEKIVSYLPLGSKLCLCSSELERLKTIRLIPARPKKVFILRLLSLHGRGKTSREFLMRDEQQLSKSYRRGPKLTLRSTSRVHYQLFEPTPAAPCSHPSRKS